MKLLSVIGLSVVVATSLSMTSFAEDVKKDKGGEKGDKGRLERFNKADADKDGKLSLAEFKTFAKGDDLDAKFAAADADKDGFLTPEELKAAKKAHKPAAKHGGAKAEAPAPAAPAAE